MKLDAATTRRIFASDKRKRRANRLGAVPRRITCPGCGQPVVAWIESLTGMLQVVDPLPITGWGEVAALLTQRTTWRWQHGEFHDRSVIEITRSPAEAAGVQVCVDHECGVPLEGKPPFKEIKLAEDFGAPKGRPARPPF